MNKIILNIFWVFVFVTSQANADTRYFGWQGSRGADGYSGSPGASGQNVTFFAQGQQAHLDLRASDGGDGSPGNDGQDAHSCHPPFRPNHNLWGANGGDGGDGGNGGLAGEGGNPIIYFRNYEDLRNITIDSTPGAGGRGSSGGRGGIGCHCREYNWTNQTCWYETAPDGSQQQRCRWDRYYCQDGRRGIDGRWGFTPGEGQLGRATLIQKDSLIEQDIYKTIINFSDIEMAKPVLAFNQWSTKSGLLYLLGNGSKVSDSYLNFEGRRKYPTYFDWESRFPTYKFAADQFSLVLKSGQVFIEQHPNIWLETETILEPNNITQIVIKKALYENEALDLDPAFRGSGRNLVLIIEDHAAVTDLLTTSINMKLEADLLLIFDKELFKGIVPEQFIHRTPNQIEIRIGEMNIDQKYLETGEDLILDMTITRSLGVRTLNRRFEQKHEIQ